MRDIEHDSEEPVIDRSNRIFWFAGALLVLLWTGYLLYIDIDWSVVGLSVFTGIAIAVWSIEMTGNKNPEWLVPRNRQRPRRSR